MNSKQEPNESIQVYVRCRPLLDSEKDLPAPVEVYPEVNKIIVRDVDSVKTFSFDKVFGPSAGQAFVYDEVAAPLVQEVLMGFNCTIFAYGQTGTGKTFTIEGDRTSYLEPGITDPLPGIIPRAMKHLFRSLEGQKAEYHLNVSFLELYNEEIFDLLSKSEDLVKLKMFDYASQNDSIVIQGLEIMPVTSMEDVYKILDKGSKKRRKAATLLNKMSSRSHTIFTAIINIKEESTTLEKTKIGKLNLVDLAGSENIGRSGAVQKRAREAGNINQSLLALGRVITSLCEKTKHVPYRESKLTRLLKDSLGGQTKTTVIATISPSQCHIEETLNTLQYALKAKNITNKPEINAQVSVKALTKDYLEEIDRSQKLLSNLRSEYGYYVDVQNWRDTETELASKVEEKWKMIDEIKELMKESSSLDFEIAQWEQKIAEKKKQLSERKKMKEELYEEMNQEKNNLAISELMFSTLQRQSTLLHEQLHKHALENFKQQSELNKMKEITRQSLKERKLLSEKLKTLQAVRLKNIENFKTSKENFFKGFTDVQENIDSLTSDCKNFFKELQISFDKSDGFREEKFTDISLFINKLEKENSLFTDSIVSYLNEQKGSKLEWITKFSKDYSFDSCKSDFETLKILLSSCEKNLAGIFDFLKGWKECLFSKIKDQRKLLETSLSSQLIAIQTLANNTNELVQKLNQAFEEYSGIISKALMHDEVMRFDENIKAVEDAVQSMEVFCYKNIEEEMEKHSLAHLKVEEFTKFEKNISSDLLQFCETAVHAFSVLQENLHSSNFPEVSPKEAQNHVAIALSNYNLLNHECVKWSTVLEDSEETCTDREGFVENEVQDASVMSYCNQLLKSKDLCEENFKQHLLEMKSFTSQEVNLLKQLSESSSRNFNNLTSHLSLCISELETKLPQQLLLNSTKDENFAQEDSELEDDSPIPCKEITFSVNDPTWKVKCPFCHKPIASEQSLDVTNVFPASNKENCPHLSLLYQSENFGGKKLQQSTSVQKPVTKSLKLPQTQSEFSVEDEIIKLLQKAETTDEEAPSIQEL